MPKDIQYLSKRRYYQLINNELNTFSDSFSSQSAVSNVASSIVEEVATFETDNLLSCRNNTLEKDASQINEILESRSGLDEGSDEEHSIELQENALELTDIDNVNESLKKDLQTLIIKHNVPHNTVNDMLRILKKHGHFELPNDVRVLMATPRNASVNIKSVADGQYVHFGIFSGLEQCIKTYTKFIKSNNIKLNINVDGLPICKSSGSQFWPIMASIENIDLYIAIYNWCIPWYV